MRNMKKAAYLCTVTILLMTAGCGHSDTNTDSGGPTADAGSFNSVIDAEAEESDRIDQHIQKNIDDQQGSDEKIDNEETGMQQPDNTQSDGIHSDNAQSDGMKSDNKQFDNVQSDNSQLQSDTELDGSIKSIADNSVIINKMFHPSANMAVIYGDDSKDSLVTVYFSEETEFEVWTVKNSGVNGDADTEKRQGAFSDLKQDHIINMTGSYDGDDFYAIHVIIYNFI